MCRSRERADMHVQTCEQKEWQTAGQGKEGSVHRVRCNVQPRSNTVEGHDIMLPQRALLRHLLNALGSIVIL